MSCEHTKRSTPLNLKDGHHYSNSDKHWQERGDADTLVHSCREWNTALGKPGSLFKKKKKKRSNFVM
jgi:hypothetical protein